VFEHGANMRHRPKRVSIEGNQRFTQIGGSADTPLGYRPPTPSASRQQCTNNQTGTLGGGRSPDRTCRAYGMQELSSTASRCTHGRYHMAPWVMLLLLDESGENLIPIPASGEVEGRPAFFDLSLEGRWGGVISGDKIRATWEPCGCGNASPSIHDDILRYADIASGDKIACSGTIDAYVRGVS
jgi:hypothetical protein